MVRCLDFLWGWGESIFLIRDVNNYRHLTNDLSTTETKLTNRLLKGLLNLTNNRRIETDQWLVTNFAGGFQPIPSWLTDQSRSTDQIYNIIDWQALFTWLWRWLPLRLSKRQSPTTVLFRITLTRTNTLYELQILQHRLHRLKQIRIHSIRSLLLCPFPPLCKLTNNFISQKFAFYHSPTLEVGIGVLTLILWILR